MIYLIVSLIAGLIYLISGKVQYNKKVYLEGTKARIAGLIFLAPVGLMLAILGIITVLIILDVSISDSSSKIIDTFASTLVRNGFMIGLGYIYFHSVSRETKDRSGCLTYWLFNAAAIALLLIYFLLPNIRSNSTWLTNIMISISVLQLVSIAGIWSWRKWGVFGYVILNLISPIIAFLNSGTISQTLISLTESLSLLLVLYLLVKPKWQFFE